MLQLQYMEKYQKLTSKIERLIINNPETNNQITWLNIINAGKSEIEYLRKNYQFDITNKSNALKQVLFSNCVQHGSRYGAEVFGDAASLANKDLNSMTDLEIIYNIYEVKLTDMSWSSGAPTLRPGLFNRWENERIMALELLKQEVQN